MRYRPEVDGLRAVAVLPVVFFHANFPYFDGGFVGVDVFFVISGYLITGIIVEEAAQERFSLVSFYERRARRILPALFLVIAFTALAAPFFLLPQQLEDFGKSVAAVMFFVSNMLFWQQSGYFGTASETSPLLHTWSLAVEEQFYVIYPLLLLLVWRRTRAHLLTVFVLLALLSIAAAEWGWRHAAIGNFFWLPTRAWELLVGSIVALAERRGSFSETSPLLRSMIATTSLVVLGATFVLFDENVPHPSVLTLLPVLATAGTLATAAPGNLAGRFLSLKPLVTIGLLSYSYYLWHQPIFAFTKLSAPERLLPGLLLALTVVSLVIAYLSWKHWEQPFRNRSRIRSRTVFRFSVAGTLGLAAVGSVSAVFSDQIFRTIYPERFANYQIVREATTTPYNEAVNRDCHIWAPEFSSSFLKRFEVCSAQHGEAVFITGDSHGIDLYNSVARSSSYPFIASVSRGYCRPHRALGKSPPHPCHYDDLLEFAARNADKLWSIIYTQTPDRLFPVPFRSAQPEDLSVTSVSEAVDYLDTLASSSGVPVIILGMLPTLRRSPLALSLSAPIPDQLPALVADKHIDLSRHIDSVFAEAAQAKALRFISKIDAMNLHLPRDLFIDRKLTYSDIRHLSAHGEMALGKRLVDYLKRNELFPPGPAAQ